MSQFHSSIRDVVAHLNPTSLFNDVLPPQVVCQAHRYDWTNVLSIINCSLTNGCVPSSLKHAVVQPLLKKPGLDPTDPNHFRPISKLPFLSKIFEKNSF